MMEVKGLDEFARAFEIDEQRRANERKAKKEYKKHLVKSGIDKEIASVMASIDMEYGIVKPM